MFQLVCTAKERLWCEENDACGPCLFFSAKESVFKALYGLIELYPGFQAVNWRRIWIEALCPPPPQPARILN